MHDAAMCDPNWGRHETVLAERLPRDEPSRRHIGDAVSRSRGLTGRSVAWMPPLFRPPPGQARAAGPARALLSDKAMPGVEERSAPDYTSNR
jgi:hypothetical protein